ncbi:ABC transporter substrate-binding protein [Clostridium minihomine]|uniref:ABC transporter substrate-binding protein n=1 Tax=Clostridium minihomine TaxID=2045012 RepID=UPI000C78428D|nr:ABC transporter substrate-binding protein [Clostridium minihomine]
MKKRMGLILSFALFTGILSGCTGTPAENSQMEASMAQTSNDDSESAWPRTVTDDFGHTITLEQKPQRIVCLYFGHIEPLIVLGSPPVAAGWATTAMNGFGTLQPYAKEAEIIDLGNPREPNLEKILEAEPDFIVGTAFFTERYEELNQIAPTLLFDSTDWKDNLNDYAAFLGAEKEAEEYIQQVDALMTTSREKLSAYRNKTFVIAWSQEKNTFGAFGSKATSQQSFFDTENGLGLTAPAGYPEKYGQISLETMADWNPDSIFIVGQLGSEETGYQQTYLHKTTEESSVWKSLKAVQNGNVYFLDASCVTGSPLGVQLAIETIVKNVDSQ